MQLRRIVIFLLIIGVLMIPIVMTTSAPARAASSDLFISEYIEGSSYNKAIEIHNGTGAIIDLAAGGYKIEMYFNGNTSASTNISLNGTVADGDVFVLAHSSADSAILAQADQTSGASFFNGDDAIVLRSNAGIVDSLGQVGIDPGSQWGSGDLSTADNTLRRQTAVCAGDTIETNVFDPASEWDGFAQDSVDDLGIHTASCSGDSTSTPTPQAATSTPTPVVNTPTPTIPAGTNCGDAATFIHTIQGSGSQSSMNGATGVTIEGVVVGDFQDSGLNGFHVQEEDSDADADAATSEGIYVYEGTTAVSVNPGDVVRVTGDVVEYETSTGSGAYLTELTNITSLIVCSSGASVTPVTLNFPLADMADFESYENMLVSFPQTLTVSGNYYLGRYGQVDLSFGRLYQPTNIVVPGDPAAAQLDLNNRSRLLLDDGDTVQNSDPVLYPAPGLSAANTLRSGDTVTGLTAVLEQRFSNYQLQPVNTINFTDSNARTAAPAAVGGSLKVASFNVLNYFNGDGSGGGFPTSRGADSVSEFDRQRDKIIAAMMAIDADVVGLMEIENDGYGGDSAIQDLVNGLNDASAPGTYSFIDPGVSAIGTDEIAVGIIYKNSIVSASGAAEILDSSVDSNFDDTKNRPALAQTFTEMGTGEKFTVAVNHLKSKGSSCDSIGDPDTGDGQGNCNLTRTSAATALVNWLATDPTNSNDADFLIIGDLNAYAMEDPITAIKNAGYTNLISQFGGATAYSYVFSGQSGYLDHALANAALLPQVTGVTEWHINADEPISLDYNEEYKSTGQIIDFYNADAYRASDHDPVMIGLALGGSMPTATPTSVPPTVTNTPLPTATPTSAPPTVTNTPLPTATATPVPPTTTNTPVPTATATQVPPTATNTPLPTATPTQVPSTATNTPLPTVTATQVPPTATNTPLPTPTNTPWPTATNTPVASAPVIYVSSSSGGSVDGVSFADEDILAFDTATGSWSLLIDGSDIGPRTDLDAFHINADGSILMSFNAATTLPDVGSVDDSDIVRFIPTATGATSAGTFERYFDGSDVGLSANGEDVDGIYVADNGNLLLSTSGSVSVTGASGNDEDVLEFVPTSLGSSTSGSWSVFMDNSDVGMSGSSDEDVWGIWLDEASNAMHLTTRGNFSVTGLSGDGANVFACSGSFGAATSCTFSMFWDGSNNGFSGERMDGLYIEP